jgi:hypothetical protein
MSTIGFSNEHEDIVRLSTRTLQLILERADQHVSELDEAEELRMALDVDGISFELVDPPKRARLVDAFRRGTLELRAELEAGAEPLPSFAAGNIPKLDEILALLDRFTPASGAP